MPRRAHSGAFMRTPDSEKRRIASFRKAAVSHRLRITETNEYGTSSCTHCAPE